MLRRPTLGACLIAKNESHNVDACLSSIRDVVDEIYFTDTGSTDDTVEKAKKYGAKVSHFDWVEDFSAARNFNLDQAETDYVLWLDLDDSLQNPEMFKLWRDTTMAGFDYWIATYHYASDPATDKPVISFARERVINRHKGMRWKYFLHEGIVPHTSAAMINVVHTWSIKHRRTVADLERDKGRNLRIFEKQNGALDARMKFYYGKELFEAQRVKEAITVLNEAVLEKTLEAHDRILAQQYLCYSLMIDAQYERAIDVAHTSLMLTPMRAEFYTVIGDCYVKQNKLAEALPFYAAAKECLPRDLNRDKCASPLFTFEQLYTTYPRNNMARIYFQIGDLNKAVMLSSESEAMGNAEGAQIKAEVLRIKETSERPKEKVSDVVMTCVGGLYEWDENVYRERGCGGSETAAIFLAKHIAEQSKRRMIVFMPRQDEVTINGVEYVPVARSNEYFSQYEPSLHIAWRHSIKMTNAPTVVWSHDLLTPGIHMMDSNNKLAVLTEFHKDYVKSVVGLSDEPFWITRNGINPELFSGLKTEKNPNKVVFSSSPDRGLLEAMKVLDVARQENPNLELHAFYGFDNLEKMGRHDIVKPIKEAIESRPWVKMHGNLKQLDLYKELASAAVWLYPTWFLETFCITALEMLALGVYPITRRLGGLSDTLKEAESLGRATLLDHGAETDKMVGAYANAVIQAVNERKWERVSLDLNKHSWAAVAQEWIDKWLSPSMPK